MGLLTLDEMSKTELSQQRECHKASIKKIKNGWNKLSFEAKYRAGKTLLNLHGQIARIDDLQGDM